MARSLTLLTLEPIVEVVLGALGLVKVGVDGEVVVGVVCACGGEVAEGESLSWFDRMITLVSRQLNSSNKSRARFPTRLFLLTAAQDEVPVPVYLVVSMSRR